ncbi:MAG TPA: YbhB/YbcL family Raf kinase inhibitor-like protein [Nannocystaceae bacterium]|nr:YbhB/YbcL family Raf kinase inhibitor-like protein [Nannocystaceae bacterium]
MSTPRWLSITVLLACACPADDDGTTGNDTGSSSSTNPTTSTTTTEASSESGTLTTTDASTSTGVDESSTAVDESSTAADESSSSTTEPVAFEIMSTELVDGGWPHTAHSDCLNESPALDWVGAPADAMSFAVFFHDLDFMPQGHPFEHSAIWNISADTTGLPHDVDHDPMPADVPGAVQCVSWMGGGNYGYGGPGSPANHYEFVLFALDSADLTGEIDETSSLAEVWDALQAHSIATATIVGQSTGSEPCP